MRRLAALAAAVIAGGAGVPIAFWLVQSVLPMALSVPFFPMGDLIILVAALAVAGLLVHRGWATVGAAWLIGAGGAWAIQEAHPLSVCASGLLWRPCTDAEIVWMVVPAVILLAAAAVLAAHARSSTRAPRD